MGNGGANRRPDVLAIQCLLNSVPAAQGGPIPRLAQDGVIGPRTIAAITAFQKHRLGWSDGRVDVNDKTMAALRTHVATLPSGAVGDPAQKKKGFTIRDFEHPDWWPAAVLETAIKQTRSIQPLLWKLGGRLTHPSPEMTALMEKHFVNPTEALEEADFGLLRRIATDMQVYMRLATATGSPTSGIFQYSQTYPDPDKDALGFTWPGGAGVPFGNLYKTSDGTIWKTAEGHTIWLTDLYAMERDTEQLLVIFHEFCHFVGDVAGGADAINDNAYAFEPVLAYLNKGAKLRNAESLALFFFECCYGTKRLLSMPRINAIRGMLSRYPHVDEGGGIDLGPKRTWPLPI